jgi:hypothetical protein
VQDAGAGGGSLLPTILRAANEFVKSPAPFKQIIVDDGCTVRVLNRNEQWMLETVARIPGHEVHDVEVGT